MLLIEFIIQPRTLLREKGTINNYARIADRNRGVWSFQFLTIGVSASLRTTPNQGDMERKSTTADRSSNFITTINTYIDVRKHFWKEVKSCGNKAFGVWCLTFLEAVSLIASRVAIRGSQRAAGTLPLETLVFFHSDRMH